VLEGIKMNSCACLLDPKKYSCVWCWFGCSKMGVFVNGFTIFFSNLSTFSTFFCFANLSRNGNGYDMEHLQGFEGLV
jgi:hypothetical protein